MERLTAARPILYRGRMYEAGEALPGDDAKMVAAWLEAGTAKISGGTTETTAEQAQEPPQGGQDDKGSQTPGTDESGAQGGTAPETDGQNTGGNEGNTEENNAGGNTGDGTEDTGDGTEGGTEDTGDGQEMVEGHLDVKKLERMTTAQLAKLAEDMGVDISAAKSNKERAAMIAAVPVLVPASENTGGAQ